MTVIRFTKFLDKILSLEKKRTIRKKRKCNCGASILDIRTINLKKDGEIYYKRKECICQIEKGDTLQVYIMLKLGEAQVTNVQKLESIFDLEDEDARLDGFKDSEEAYSAFQEMYKNALDNFRIIDFDPGWEPQKIILLKERNSNAK